VYEFDEQNISKHKLTCEIEHI